MDELARQAIRVLRTNDRGTWTRPSPRLYPHQWSWDAAFVAIGWAHFAPLRAVTELRSLFRGQWENGMVPQIVFDPDRCACLDRDLVADRWVSADTIAGFAPLVAGCDDDRAGALASRLFGASFAGADALRWAVPPTTAVDDPAFDRRSYWRGPTWPVITWLLWWALDRDGHHAAADQLHGAALAQLRSSGCSEYADPVSGEPLGSTAQSWTAAVALDWLAHEPVSTPDLVS